jgi:hypothetical protein
MNSRLGALLCLTGLCLASATPQPSAPADEASCKVALAALTSPSADDRERAARMLYDHCSRKILTEDPAAAPALRKAVESGSGAAAILLLGNFRDAESIRTLRDSNEAGKTAPSSVPVPAPLAAAVNTQEIRSLGTGRPNNKPAEAEFLLDALGEIEPGPAMRTSPSVPLTIIAERGGVPSGAQPASMCDAAVDAFAARPKPELNFPHAVAHYLRNK